MFGQHSRGRIASGAIALLMISAAGCTTIFDPTREHPDCEFEQSTERCGEARIVPQNPQLPFNYQPKANPSRAIIGG
jgi:hypothetical protein